ncbi:MAG: hypothetical protein KDB03_20375 [Planctomycetales bacterium]|nr:hypothetical protein [Planctomycetales bacterium]
MVVDILLLGNVKVLQPLLRIIVEVTAKVEELLCGSAFKCCQNFAAMFNSVVQQHAHAAAIRDLAMEQGMWLLRDSGQAKIEAGLTTLEEIERVTMRAES